MGSLTPWLIIGAIALSGVTGWQGHRIGYAAAEDDHRTELLAQIEAGQKLEAARWQLEQELDKQASKNEEQAYAEPVVIQQCLGPSRVFRLNTSR
ncbi:MAG: hypothetical protein AB3N12_01415 [Ruegeria sp.]